MNACGGSVFEERNNPKKFSRNAVENIIFSGIPKAGTYKVFINNFAKVENIDLGFEVGSMELFILMSLIKAMFRLWT